MSNLHHTSKSSKQQTIQSFFNKSRNQSTSDAPTSSRGFDESHSFKRFESEKKLMLLLNENHDYENQFGCIMLINKIRFEEHK